MAPADDGREPASAPPEPASAASTPAEKPIRFTAPVDPEPTELAAFYAQRAEWADCSDDETFRCATVRVPVDYDHPAGATVSISLRMLPAGDHARRRGSLLVNPGGPGGSGLDLVTYADDAFGDDVRDVYDIVGFDPRGMGQSGGFDCLTDADLDAMYAADPSPDTPKEVAALAAAARARLATCVRRGGALALHMGTESVARDLDVLRAAVGDTRLNYYGASYGTLIGALYADTFTSRVGLMVLDSAVTPDGLDSGTITQADVDDRGRAWANAFDDTFSSFVDECGGSGGCPLGDGREEVTATVTTLLDRLESDPLPADSEAVPLLTEGWATVALREALADPESWSYLVDALDAAAHDEDGTDLAWIGMVSVERDDDGYPATSYGRNHLPVTCSDWPPTAWDASRVSAEVRSDHLLWARVALDEVPQCAGWRGPLRTDLLVGAEPATPVLVIGNLQDPVTPIEDTEHLARMLVRSRLVEVDAEGHVAYRHGNSCADDAVDAYLARAVPPENGLTCNPE